MTACWHLRFAPHLGYLPDGEPQFLGSVASADPWEHARFAADRGFAGLLSPWAICRPDEQVARLRDALGHFGLKSGCIAIAPPGTMFEPLWIDAGSAAERRIDECLDRAISLARSLGAASLVTVMMGAGDGDRAAQERVAVRRLRRAGDRAAAAGLILGVEPMTVRPGMWLVRTEQAVALLDRVAHPAVRLVFDTGHVWTMDGDVPAAYRLARRHIGLIQLADMPGRIEPGAGEIDFAALLEQAFRDGNCEGLVELEHGWTKRSPAIEAEGIAMLGAIDRLVLARTSRDPSTGAGTIP